MKKRGLTYALVGLLMAGCSTSPAAPTPDAAPADSLESLARKTPKSPTAPAPAPAPTPAPEPTAPVGPSTAQVRADGTLTVNGQAMFPMGFYHVSWAGDAERRMRDMHAIADLGFNTMNSTMFDPEGDLEGYRKLLDAAQARGMKMLVEDFNETSIRTFKDHPALLGWMVADDCNRLVSPEELQRRSESVKQLDPNHLTYTSMAISYASSHTEYFGRADAVGNQSYPVDGGDPLNVVYPMMTRLVAEASAKGTLPIANLQSFRWENGRYPTPAELNNMTNQAIAAGVKGILYYTYLDRTNDLASYTGLNDELRRLASEVKVLAPALTEGQRTELPAAASNRQVKAHMWTYGSRRYVQVVSLDDTVSQSVKVQLPGTVGSLQPLFAERRNTLTLQGTTAAGTLAPLSSQWYELR